MENLKQKRQGKIIVFLCIVSLVLAFSTVYFAFAGNRMRRNERLISEKAVSSLCESLDSISVSLRKSLYSTDKKALSKAGNELCRQAAAAKESLSLLSPDREICDEIYKFLSQVGNYTLAVAQGEEKISKEHMEGLKALYTYAEGLSLGMNEICLEYYNGDISFGDALGNLEKQTQTPDADFYSRVYDTAQTLTDYPTLVYDGPFADNNAGGRAVFLESEGEITADEAAQKVAELLGVQASTLKREEDINGDLELYSFSKGKTDVTVTKKGGYICSVLSDTYAFEETISAEEALRRAEKYLARLGYEAMESSYYSTYDGICTVNYASRQDDAICYSDLIKVSISLDTGNAVALDARAYLLSHRKRETGNTVSSREAIQKLPDSLSLIECRLAWIPLDSGREALCYELHCRDGESREVLIYLDAYTLEQRDTLILLYSDGGVLTK